MALPGNPGDPIHEMIVLRLWVRHSLLRVPSACLGKGRFACILALEKTAPGLSVQAVHEALSIHEEIVHLSVELR